MASRRSRESPGRHICQEAAFREKSNSSKSAVILRHCTIYASMSPRCHIQCRQRGNSGAVCPEYHRSFCDILRSLLAAISIIDVAVMAEGDQEKSIDQHCEICAISKRSPGRRKFANWRLIGWVLGAEIESGRYDDRLDVMSCQQKNKDKYEVSEIWQVIQSSIHL
jgi:hypothetical protein